MKSSRFILMVVMMFITTCSLAQEKAAKKYTTAQTTSHSYACPMHPNFVSDSAGKWPKCSKDLTLSRKEQMKTEVVKLYTCDMHLDVSSSEPGKCPNAEWNL